MLSSISYIKKRVSSLSSLTLLVPAILMLIGGGIVYIAFRSLSLRMFGWCDALGLMGFVTQVRSLCINIHPSQFVLYNLPDLLWIVSYLLFVNALIPKTDRKVYLFWIMLMPTLAIVHEILQGLGFTAGSFDFIDVLCYFIPLLINIILTSNIQLTHFNHEKVF